MDSFIGPVLPRNVQENLNSPQVDSSGAAFSFGSPALQTSQPLNAPTSAPLNAPATMPANTNKSTGTNPLLPSPAGTTDQYSDIYKRSQNALLTDPTPAKSQDQIYQDRLKQSQGLIDSINQNFFANEQIASRQGAELNKQTRQAMISQGLAGSSAAVPAIQKTNDANNAVMQSLQAQRANQIQTILTGVQKYADEEFVRQQEQYRAEAMGNIEMVDKLKKQKLESVNAAKENFLGLAKMGVDLKQLKALDPEQHDQVLKNSGYDDTGLAELAYNAVLPKAQQIDYKFEKLADGQGLFYGIDPKTGELKQIKTSVEIPPDYQLVMGQDGTPILFNKQTGDARIAGSFSEGQFGKDETGLISGNTTYTPGADPVVDSWAKRIMGGQAKLSDLTGVKNTGLKNKVVMALDAMSGNRLGPVQQNIAEAKKLVQELIDHPGREATTGVPNFFTNPLGMSLPSSNAREFKAKVERLNALLFLNAVPQMKGMGQLTEREGAKLEASASVTKEFGMGEGAYLDELKRLKTNLDSAFINLGGDDTLNINKGTGNIIEFNGKRYETDADGNFDPNSPLASAGSDANNAQDVTKIANAIGQYESGGNYKALGPVVTSGQYKGERALGKYQVMPGNVASWTKQALGYSMTPQQFLNDPKAQDAVAYYKMGKLMEQGHGLEDIASIWFSGRPLAKAGNAKDVIGTTVPKYVANIKAIYNRLG